MRRLADALRLTSDIAKDLLRAQIARIILFMHASTVRCPMPVTYRLKDETALAIILLLVRVRHLFRQNKPPDLLYFAFFFSIENKWICHLLYFIVVFVVFEGLVERQQRVRSDHP